MKTRATKWGTKQYRLQVVLSERDKAALDRYIEERFSPGSRAVSAVVRRAIVELLEREGYPNRQGGEKM